MRALAWCAVIALAVSLDASCDCDPSKLNTAEKCVCPEIRRHVRSLGYGPLNWHVPEFRHVMTTTPVPLPPAADNLGVYYLPAEEFRSNEQRSYVIRPKSYLDEFQPENASPDSVVSPSVVQFKDVHNHKNSFLDQMQPDSTYSASYPTSIIVKPSLNKEESRETPSPNNYFHQVQPQYTFSSSYPSSAVAEPSLKNGEFLYNENAKDYFLGQMIPKYPFSASNTDPVTGHLSQNKGQFRYTLNPTDYLLDQIKPEYTYGVSYPNPNIAQIILNKGELREIPSPKNDYLEKVQSEDTFRSSYPNSIIANPSKSALSHSQNAEGYLLTQAQPQLVNPYLLSQIQPEYTIPYHGSDPVTAQSGPSQAQFKYDQNQKYYFDTIQSQYIIPYPSLHPFTAQSGTSLSQFRDDHKQKNYFLGQTQTDLVIPYLDVAHTLPQIDINQGTFGDDMNKKIYSDKIDLEDIVPYPSVYADLSQPGLSQSPFMGHQNQQTKTFDKNPKTYVPYRTFSENPDYFLDQIQSKDTYKKVYPEIPTNVFQPSSSSREFRDSLDNTRSYLDVSFDGGPSQFRASEPDIETVKNTMMNCMDLQLLLLINTSKEDNVNKSFWNKTYTEGIVNEHQLRRQIQLMCRDPEKTLEDSVQDITNFIMNKTSDGQNKTSTANERDSQNLNKTLYASERDSQNLNKTLKANENTSQNFTVRIIDDAEKSAMVNNSKSVTESELSEENGSSPTKKVKHFIDYEYQSPKSEEYEDKVNPNYYDAVTEIVVNSKISDQTTKRPSIDPTFDITLTPLARRKRTRRGDEDLIDADSKENSSRSYEKLKRGYERGRTADSLSESQRLSDGKKISGRTHGKRPMYKQSELKIPTVEIHELASGKIVVLKGIEKLPNNDVFPSDLDAKNALATPTIETVAEYESADVETIPKKDTETVGNDNIIKTMELPTLEIVILNKDENRTMVAKLPLVLADSEEAKN